MSFRQQLAVARPDGDTVLTIGVFDGVHMGHRHLLRRLVKLARPHYRPGVVTFTNHPITVLRPGTEVKHITTSEQKRQLLEAQGIELVAPLEFTPELAQVSAEEFTGLLAEDLRVKGLVIGPDFALGRNRQGNAAFLTEMGRKLGFWVETVEPLLQNGILVKSRQVRQVISQGDMTTAAQFLGRKFSLTGTVVHGDGRGRQLGFPTANVVIDPRMLLPGDGIYATWAIIEGQRHPSAASIGVRPTFDLSERLVEVYVIDFRADLYGQEVTIEFVTRLRGQEKFSTIDALIEQIAGDVAGARLALARDNEG